MLKQWGGEAPTAAPLLEVVVVVLYGEAEMLKHTLPRSIKRRGTQGRPLAATSSFLRLGAAYQPEVTPCTRTPSSAP